LRFDALEPCVHRAHLLAHLQQQAEQLGAVPSSAVPLSVVRARLSFGAIS
jgi:hypothetical protein